MAITRTLKTLQASTSRSAGAGATTGSAYVAGTAKGMEIIGTITNGATGPTLGCQFTIEISGDGTNWRKWYRGLAGTEANGVYAFPVFLPREVIQARSVFEGNTGQSVTVECLGHELTTE